MTKIQPRILERLEGGKLDGLPAEVFVRGFIRSFAKCCGLDETEALSRYTAASQAQAIATAPATPSTLATPAARAMVDAMSELAPHAARATKTVEVVTFASGSLEMPAAPTEIVAEASTSIAVAPSAPAANASASISASSDASAPTAASSSNASSKKKRRGGKRAKRKSLATGTPSSPTPVVTAAVDTQPDRAPEVAERDAATTSDSTCTARDVATTSDLASHANVTASCELAASTAVDVELDDLKPVDQLDPLVVVPVEEDIVATDPWQPKMPPISTTTASVPWRRPYATATTTAASARVPRLVIDDSDPESAAQVLEDREAEKAVTTLAQRRSFLPPILLDREDRSARQGGLTLAVIILLIAATLTLSYLMRRPSSSGDGVTQRAVETQQIG